MRMAVCTDQPNESGFDESSIQFPNHIHWNTRQRSKAAYDSRTETELESIKRRPRQLSTNSAVYLSVMTKEVRLSNRNH